MGEVRLMDLVTLDQLVAITFDVLSEVEMLSLAERMSLSQDDRPAAGALDTARWLVNACHS